jgi:hypothetical protein
MMCRTEDLLHIQDGLYMYMYWIWVGHGMWRMEHDAMSALRGSQLLCPSHCVICLRRREDLVSVFVEGVCYFQYATVRR